MRPFSDRALLLCWEQGLSQSLIERSLRLVIQAFPELDISSAASLSIGDRDARLLQIRKYLFGSQLQNTAHCPACTEKVEWEMALSTLELQSVQTDQDTRQVQVEIQNEQWTLRLPNTLDVLEVLDLPDPQAQTNVLIQRCLMQPVLPFEQIEAYPVPVKETILEQMEALDPQANIEMNIECAACGHTWPMLFDIMRYLWTEIDQRARDLLQEVFFLARNFGWSEAAILQMSRTRRNWYLQMLSV